MERHRALLCSSGAFMRGDFALTNHQAILHYGPMLAVDGLEVLFFAEWYPQTDRIAADLLASDLHFPVLHAEKSIGPALGSALAEERMQAIKHLEINCRFGKQLGTRLVILHLWGLPGGDEHFERNLAMLSDCLTVAANAGLDLAVETIPCDRANPLSNVQRAIDQDRRCLIALDTEFLTFHQQLEESLAAGWLWQEQRVRHIHIKDYDGQMVGPDGYRRYLHPGEGKIDFAGFFRGLAQREFNGSISLEASGVQRDLSIDLNQIQSSLALLGRLMGR